MTVKKSGKKAHSAVSIAGPAAEPKTLSKTAVPEGHQPDWTGPDSKREKVAVLAYLYWIQRGCHGGSADEDWFRAEREINFTSSS